jgi:tight adherence protein C
MLIATREIHMGVPEGAAYESFGKRTGVREYVRLSTFLTQNLKKGSSTLLQQLKEESVQAEELRIQNARKLSEEATTKLLLPMVMLLVVVMVMIMVPAFSNAGI